MRSVMLYRWAFCVTFAAVMPVAAAEAPLKFKVADNQREALGIQIEPLKRRAANRSRPPSPRR